MEKLSLLGTVICGMAACIRGGASDSCHEVIKNVSAICSEQLDDFSMPERVDSTGFVAGVNSTFEFTSKGTDDLGNVYCVDFGDNRSWPKVCWEFSPTGGFLLFEFDTDNVFWEGRAFRPSPYCDGNATGSPFPSTWLYLNPGMTGLFKTSDLVDSVSFAMMEDKLHLSVQQRTGVHKFVLPGCPSGTFGCPLKFRISKVVSLFDEFGVAPITPIEYRVCDPEIQDEPEISKVPAPAPALASASASAPALASASSPAPASGDSGEVVASHGRVADDGYKASDVPLLLGIFSGVVAVLTCVGGAIGCSQRWGVDVRGTNDGPEGGGVVSQGDV